MTTSAFTFNLGLPAECADYTTFAHGFVSNLGSIEVNVYGHCIDAGDLGHLEVDLEDVEVDLSDAIGDYTIRNAVREAKFEGACGEDFTHEVTLTDVRESYCREHGCSPYEFLAAVGEEIAIAAMNERDRAVRHELRQEVERARAGTEADNLLVEQSLKDRDKAQKLMGSQAEIMRQAIVVLREAQSHFSPEDHWGTPRHDDYVEMSNKIKALFEMCEKHDREVAAEYFPVTETETETETTTNSTDAEA